MRILTLSLVWIWLWNSTAKAALTPEQQQQLPPAAVRPIRFSQDIQPLLEASCIRCHGRGKAKGEFRIDTREMLLKGGQSGPVVVPGNSAQSLLIELVSGLNPDEVMPQKGSRLKPEQVGLLRAWIDQGLPWDASVQFGRLTPGNLLPRRPPFPTAAPGKPVSNPIDLFLQPYWAAHPTPASPPVSDRVYARRVYLDIIGLIPSADELEAFVKDTHPDKRRHLVQRLLADNQRYAEHWLTFWNDALRNDYQGTGYIDGGRKQITPWLYSALARNVPYDHFVAQLVNPSSETEGFTRGIVWRGVVNASQTPQMQAAQNIAQVFMGVNLKCASCHDSFINDWTLADAYGLAGIYAGQPLEMVHCDKPTGQRAPLKFLYPELGHIDPQLPQSERLQRLAELMTAPQNGRLSRTIVNRLWAKCFGHGLVEPVDEMENPAWHQDLLDWLAADLVDHGYDLKHTIALMLTSAAYQMPAVNGEDQSKLAFVFRGPLVRRMSAEQYSDAVSTLTGVWKTLPANRDINFAAAPDTDSSNYLATLPVQSRWIGLPTDHANATTTGTFYLRKTVHLAALPTQAAIVCAGDRSFILHLNGKEIASGRDFHKPVLQDILPSLRVGDNTIAVSVTPTSTNSPATDLKAPPGAFVLYARLRSDAAPGSPSSDEKVWDFATDTSWSASTHPISSGDQSDASETDWEPAQDLGDLAAAPWHLAKTFAGALSVAAQDHHVRAALVPSDPLLTAMGRPNREQTVTSRPEAATTLQALELTNGATLASLLHQGARRWVENATGSSREVVQRLYEFALGRPPTPEEMTTSIELAGTPLRTNGVEDLLWAMLMLPEFQLIY